MNITYSIAEERPPTLCLNMIVKNESKIIIRLLESVCNIIDSYCICDTGSTDNTIEIIQNFFDSRTPPILGKIVQEPFRDFAYNRTFALNACRDVSNADYLLLLDADMIFWINPEINIDEFKRRFTKGNHHFICQGTEDFYYRNVRIVQNIEGISYWGVTHEYVNLPPNSDGTDIEKSVSFIKDIGDGGCKSDKFIRDIRLLKKGLEEIPDDPRYTFYLANSYYNNGQKHEAIAAYTKRTKLGGWIEEIWYSHFNIGIIYNEMGDIGNALKAWLDAHESFPFRVENLYEIVRYYRCHGKYILANWFYNLARIELDKKCKDVYLFMQKDIYDYRIDYEMTIIGYYSNINQYDLKQLSLKVLEYPHLEDSVSKSVLCNYKFYTESISTWNTHSCDSLIAVMKTIGVEKMKDETDFNSSTPSIIRISDTKYVVNVRYVNYYVGENGEYIQRSKIESKNIFAILETGDSGNTWSVTSEEVLKYDTCQDDHYVGIEDVRLYKDSVYENVLLYNANRQLKSSIMCVETGVIDILTGQTISPIYPKIPGQGSLEKNWVITPNISGGQNNTKMIYGWSPLIIGDIDEKSQTFNKTHEIATPHFFRYLRGSTNGVLIGDEIWFICHLVSYEERRYYYHLFVVLDSVTLSIKKYTPFFTFEKEKVEYTLGFTYDSTTDEFLIGYSVLDKRTEYITIPKSKLSLMVPP